MHSNWYHFTEDQEGLDSKIIATPISKIGDWSTIGDSNDFNLYLLNKLKHFIEHHKDLEKDKFVKIREFGNTVNLNEKFWRQWRTIKNIKTVIGKGKKLFIIM